MPITNQMMRRAQVVKGSASIKANAETFKAQVFKILDPEKTVIDFNARWLGKLTSADWIKLCYETQKPANTQKSVDNDDYSQWQYSQKLYLNTTSGGANMRGKLSQFPILVRLDPGVFGHFDQLDAGNRAHQLAGGFADFLSV
jgi:hypothetical protein